MYRYHPSPGGEYKRQDNTIIETLPGHATPRVRFAPTSASALATPSAMESLCAHYRAQFDRDEASLLVLIALFVLSEFEERLHALLDSSKSKREAVELVAMALPVPFRTADVVERLPHISRSTISKTLAGL